MKLRSQRIDIGHPIWNHVYLYDLPHSIPSEKECIALLDEICQSRDLYALGLDWMPLALPLVRKRFEKALSIDLAYQAPIRSPEEVALLMGQLFDEINRSPDAFAFTNWNVDLFEQGGGYSPLTEYTLDLALPIFYGKQLMFAYFLGED